MRAHTRLVIHIDNGNTYDHEPGDEPSDERGDERSGEHDNGRRPNLDDGASRDACSSDA